MTRKEYARKYYTERYGDVCPELDLVINQISESEDLTREQMINAVENLFWDEWDAGIDMWYRVFVNCEMTMKQYYDQHEAV